MATVLSILKGLCGFLEKASFQDTQQLECEMAD